MKVAACYERSELFMKVTTLLEAELTPSQKPNRSDRQERYIIAVIFIMTLR